MCFIVHGQDLLAAVSGGRVTLPGPTARVQKYVLNKIPIRPGEDKVKNRAFKTGEAKHTQHSTFSLQINVMVS